MREEWTAKEACRQGAGRRRERDRGTKQDLFFWLPEAGNFLLIKYESLKRLVGGVVYVGEGQGISGKRRGVEEEAEEKKKNSTHTTEVAPSV